MIAVQLQVDTDILDQIADTVRQSPGLMNTAAARYLGRRKSDLLRALRTEPGAPSYPLRWKSARQRRYVMAKLRREGNLPYRRTHALATNWDVVLRLDNDGGTFTVENDTPYARYVQGDDAQPFHMDTGWPQVTDYAADYEAILNDGLIEVWYTVSDPFAGARG